jgi:hypothetical protein
MCRRFAGSALSATRSSQLPRVDTRGVIFAVPVLSRLPARGRSAVSVSRGVAPHALVWEPTAAPVRLVLDDCRQLTVWGAGCRKVKPGVNWVPGKTSGDEIPGPDGIQAGVDPVQHGIEIEGVALLERALPEMVEVWKAEGSGR